MIDENNVGDFVFVLEENLLDFNELKSLISSKI